MLFTAPRAFPCLAVLVSGFPSTSHSLHLHTGLFHRSSRRPTEVYFCSSLYSMYDSVTQAASAVCRLSATFLVIHLHLLQMALCRRENPSLAELTFTPHRKTYTYLRICVFVFCLFLYIPLGFLRISTFRPKFIA
ncbi:hypothetical protein F4781DRAFT_5816 [Annulohypoxylon bovei var. microspora]|nr:hypothetical protein F4781DRAFT_5816 [Annulohypoxylon bovei var. microspora]